MPEQVSKILNTVLEWWNKFTSRQKTIIIAISAGIIMTLAVLLTVMNQTQYTPFITAKSTQEGGEIRDLLEGSGIKYQVSNDGLRFDIDRKQQANANLLMGVNNIQSDIWSIENVTGTGGGFSTTEADKQKLYKKYLESQINSMAATIGSVKSATTILDMPANDGTLLSQEKEKGAMILLQIDGEFTEEMAANLAKGISVSLGSSTPEKITIMDSGGRMLFDGSEIHSTTGGSASNQQAVKNKAEAHLNNEIRKIMLGTGEYHRVDVASNLPIDFSSTRSTDNHYYIPSYRDDGYAVSEYTYEAESTMGGGGVPGTDSNTEDRSYMWRDSPESSSSERERSVDRVVSQVITESDLPPGSIIYDDSSASVTTVRYNIIQEEDVRRQGLLDGISWEVYKEANSERTIIDVPEELYSLVANASGIPYGSITILSFAENTFIDAEGIQVSWTDITQIILIIVILGLLAFVVIRSMRTAKEEELEEELSVERLLQSQPELEDIAVDDGSESKKMIDKFVEDNPEAAASLLRNWLNEDWG